jgi:hypothetical protein
MASEPVDEMMGEWNSGLQVAEKIILVRLPRKCPDGNTDQRGFNDMSEDFKLFKSRVLGFEGRDDPAMRGLPFSKAKAVQDMERQKSKC